MLVQSTWLVVKGSLRFCVYSGHEGYWVELLSCDSFISWAEKSEISVRCFIEFLSDSDLELVQPTTTKQSKLEDDAAMSLLCLAKTPVSTIPPSLTTKTSVSTPPTNPTPAADKIDHLIGALQASQSPDRMELGASVCRLFWSTVQSISILVIVCPSNAIPPLPSDAWNIMILLSKSSNTTYRSTVKIPRMILSKNKAAYAFYYVIVYPTSMYD